MHVNFLMRMKSIITPPFWSFAFCYSSSNFIISMIINVCIPSCIFFSALPSPVVFLSCSWYHLTKKPHQPRRCRSARSTSPRHSRHSRLHTCRSRLQQLWTWRRSRKLCAMRCNGDSRMTRTILIDDWMWWAFWGGQRKRMGPQDRMLIFPSFL